MSKELILETLSTFFNVNETDLHSGYEAPENIPFADDGVDIESMGC
jgi:hypothetical protein